MLVPLEPARAETSAGNSRFLALLEPVESAEAARAFIARCRAQYPEATHHVPAFILGGGNSVSEFCSDDGEPSGTAGRPLLAVLKGSGLGNAAVVVVRWFGGTLLGTGGLVKAYADAGKAVLSAARKAELVPGRRLAIELPYQLYEKAKSTLLAAACANLAERFEETVRLEADVPEDALPGLERTLADLSSGSLKPESLGQISMRRPIS